MSQPGAMAPQLAPDASPLHPQSVVHNTQILSSLGTLSACFSGLIAGILGLTNSSGFLLYLLSSAFTALTLAAFKCNFNLARYVPQAQDLSAGRPAAGAGGKQAKGKGKGAGGVSWKGWFALAGIGQENLLGFLLFWIGSYALIHVYD
ncbi:hypothetical protein IAT38_001456 [Cryptococcus sp. DSM 104549]